MKNNLSNIDRGIRITAALGLIAVYLFHPSFRLSDIALLLLGPSLLLSGLRGICPIYDITGIRSVKPVAQHAFCRRNKK
jgi:hypothetical protein